MNLRAKDLAHVWHPFTPYSRAADNRVIVRGEGALLFDDQGNSLIDAVGSWWVNLHGHAHPHIAEGLALQARTLEHTLFAGFTHPPAIELAERLLSHLPFEGGKIFYSDNGSTAVEVALKMAIQSRFNRGQKSGRVVALEHSYHGDTFGAMAVGARGLFNQPFDPLLFDVERIPAPLPGQEDSLSRAVREACANAKRECLYLRAIALGRRWHAHA